MDLETRSTEKIEEKAVTDNFQSRLGCCLGELLPSLHIQKKKGRVSRRNVQMFSGMCQFFSELASHGTVEMEQIAKDRSLLS